MCKYIILFCLLLYYVNSIPPTATDIEKLLETQIDPRLPSSFQRFETLQTRSDGFQYIIRYENGEKIITDIGNWENYIRGYWWEYRKFNETCPQLPRGIAAEADLALQCPCLFGDLNKKPKVIFVHSYMLSHFVESTLNFMDKSWRFVLISGGTDMTVPKASLDVRQKPIRGFGGNDGGKYFKLLINNPQLIHWFAENRDILHPKLSSLPTGMASYDQGDNRTDYNIVSLHVKDRPLLVMNADRIRDGYGQWADRAAVFKLCKVVDWCIQPYNGTKVQNNNGLGLYHSEFIKHLEEVPFILCVHGGGVDPSPKAWEAIIAGTIPILIHSVVDDAYKHLPVAFIDNYKDFFAKPNETIAKLNQWIAELGPYYEPGSELRKKTLQRLTTKYWMEQVYHKYDDNSVSVDSIGLDKLHEKLIQAHKLKNYTIDNVNHDIMTTITNISTINIAANITITNTKKKNITENTTKNNNLRIRNR